MEIKVNIPDDYKGVLEVWEIENNISAHEWLGSIMLGNLRDMVKRKAEGRITADMLVKEFDWKAEKIAALKWYNEMREG